MHDIYDPRILSRKDESSTPTRPTQAEPRRVDLAGYDFEYGKHIGFAREHAWAMSGRSQNSHGATDITPKTRVFGTIAELAVCRWLGITWRPELLPNPAELDIPCVCEVRSGSKHNHRLLIRPKDHQWARYVHLTSEDDGRSWIIHGWLTGFVAMNEKYLAAPGTCSHRKKAYFVPREILHGVDTFKM